MADIDMPPELRQLQHRSGAQLNLEPTNATLAEVARTLLEGHTVHVMLEPGDMTLYDFYLIPMWGEGMRPRYLNLEDSLKFVRLVQHNLDEHTMLVPFTRNDTEVYYGVAEKIRNEWTTQLLSCFLLRLADEAWEQSQRKSHAWLHFENITKEDRG